MKAKEYLLQIKKLDRLIENKLIEIERWKAIASGATGSSEMDRVQSSRTTNDKMADAVVYYLELESEINEAIDELVDTKREIIQVIEQLPVEEYDMLHKVYVQHKALNEVAIEMCHSYSWATTIHGSGLAKVQKIINQKEKVKKCEKLL